MVVGDMGVIVGWLMSEKWGEWSWWIGSFYCLVVRGWDLRKWFYLWDVFIITCLRDCRCWIRVFSFVLWLNINGYF